MAARVESMDDVLDILGGARVVLGTASRSRQPPVKEASQRLGSEPGATGWVQIIREGLPAAAFKATAEALRVPQQQLATSLRLAPRTLHRRLERKERLSPEESERSIFVARALARAQAVLGPEGRTWLLEPSRPLGGVTPLSLLDTADGFTAVMDELGRIDYGLIG